jgi:hypothetical protein
MIKLILLNPTLRDIENIILLCVTLQISFKISIISDLEILKISHTTTKKRLICHSYLATVMVTVDKSPY